MPDKCGAGGFFHHAHHAVAHLGVGGGKHNHLILLCAAKHIIFRTLAVAFHQHLKGFAHIVAVAAQRQFVLQSNHAVEAIYFHFFAHIVGQMLGGKSAGAFAVFKHKRRVESHFAHQREGFLEIFFRFVVKSGKHVAGDAAVGHGFANFRNAVEIPFAGVFPVHEFEHLVAAALHRQVNVVANIGVRCHGGNNFVGQIFRVAGGEPHTHFRRRFCHDGKQCRHIHGLTAVGGFVEIAVHVLSQQNHLLEALALQIAQFIENAFRLAAAFSSAGVGHNAVGAEIVAAAHNADVAAHLVATEALRNHIAIGFGGRQGGFNGFVSRFGRANEVGQFEIRVGSCHNIHIVVADEHLFQALRHATDNAHQQAALAMAS